MKQLEKQRQADPLIKLHQEDKQVTDRYLAHPEEQFHYTSKKSLARNHRDYSLRQAVVDETATYGVYQPAADYAMGRAALLETEQQTVAGSLNLQTTMANLCRCQLTAKTMGAQDYISLVDQLTAGVQIQGLDTHRDSPLVNALRQDGAQALQEIYLQQLESMDKKYGDKLCKLSAYDYLKALPAIEADFACLQDMNQFFQPGMLDEAQTAKLRFYTRAMALLQRRAQALTALEIGAVTVKGELTKEATRAHATEMAEIRQQAKADKAFRPTAKRPPLATHFQLLNQEKQASKQALLSYTTAKSIEEEEHLRIADMLQELDTKMADYVSYKQAETALASPHQSEVAKRVAQSRIDTYRKRNGILTEEQFQEFEARHHQLRVQSQAEAVDITPENVVEMMEQETKALEAMGTYLYDSTASEFRQMLIPMGREAQRCSLQVQLIEQSFLNKYAEELRNKQPAAIQDYPLKKTLTDRFHQFRQVSDGARVVLQYDTIVRNRLQQMSKYGTYQGETMAEAVDIQVERQKMQASQLETQPTMTFAQAKGFYIKPRLLEYPPVDDLIELNKVQNVLAACQAIAQYKQQCPDLYRLGQSHRDYVHCEHLLAILAPCQQAYQLTLKRFGLVGRDQATLADLEAQRVAAVNAYDDAVSAYSNLPIASADAPGTAEALLDGNLAKNHQLAQSLRHPALANNPELLDKLTYFNGFLFVDSQHQETGAQDLEDLLRVATVQRDAEALPAETVQSATAMLHRFSQAYTAVSGAVSHGRSYSDATLVEHQIQLEQCAIMAFALDGLMAEGDLQAKLDKAYGDNPLLELPRTQLRDFRANKTTIQALSDYATGLQLRQLKSNDATVNRVFTQLGEATMADGQQMNDMIFSLFQESQGTVEALRRRKAEEGRETEMATMAMQARVRDQVQREFIANARTSKWYDARGALDWLGSRLGVPLQFLSWMLHEKRTANHGSCRYEAEQTAYETKLAGQNTLPLWQRGGTYAPPVQLEKYYKSPLKTGIAQILRDQAALLSETHPLDVMEFEFHQAVTALKSYSGVQGIVNSDTTEMEMAFLERFQLLSSGYLDLYDQTDDPFLQGRCQFLQTMSQMLKQNLRGTMAETMPADQLAEIQRTTVAYVEDTCYGENMEESNIADIPLFLHEPSIQDVRQSSVGDCWLVSAIGSIAKTDPDYIRSMFHDCGDGNVLVRLFAADDESGHQVESKYHVGERPVTYKPVYFKVRKHYETGWGNASDCTWVQLLEKAFALSGFNTRNVMKIRGNKLYNVADELTMGQINLAAAHLCGTMPPSLRSLPTIQENNFLNEAMRKQLATGLQADIGRALEIQLMECQLEYADKTVEAQRAVSWPDIKAQLMVQGRYIVDGQFEDVMSAPQSEIDQHMAPILRQLEDNYQTMLHGQWMVRNAQGEAVQYDTQMQALAQYFHSPRTSDMGRYDQKAVNFYQQCKETFALGGNVSVSIPHCVSLIDAQAHQGKLFLLMRDPFNIYNVLYQAKGEGKIATEEGLTQVATKRQLNRHLGDTPEDVILGGFRGTSWWELDDLMAKLGSANPILPQQFRTQ